MIKKTTAPATTTERVAALRARRSREGLVRLEVYARVEQHKLIRDFVRMLNKSVDVTGNDG
jgi:hypothetical protein